MAGSGNPPYGEAPFLHKLIAWLSNPYALYRVAVDMGKAWMFLARNPLNPKVSIVFFTEPSISRVRSPDSFGYAA